MSLTCRTAPESTIRHAIRVLEAWPPAHSDASHKARLTIIASLRMSIDKGHTIADAVAEIRLSRPARDVRGADSWKRQQAIALALLGACPMRDCDKRTMDRVNRNMGWM